MNILGIATLFLTSLNALKAHDKELVYLDPQRQAIFEQCIKQFAKMDTCYSNAEFLLCYTKQMQRNNIRWYWDNIQFKRETNQFMKAHRHSKIWDQEYEPHYKVCLDHRTLTENNNPAGERLATAFNYSTQGTLNLYPYLKNNLGFSKITEMLDFLPLALKNFLMILRFRIFGGIVNIESWPAKTGSYQHDFESYFGNLGDLPDCDFLLYTRDQLHQIFIYDFVNVHCPNAGHIQYDGYWELYMRVIIELPAFMQSKDLAGNLEFNKLLMVDIYIATGQWSSAMEQLQEAAKNHPWQSKVPKAYWRGAANGRQYGYIDIWSDIPNYFTRMEAVLIGQKNPQQLDAQFHRDVNLDYIKMHKLGLKSSLAPDATYEQQMKFKYMLSIDGWTASWLRVPWILYSGSLLLKQESPRVQWFYNQIEPGKHYISVKRDLSDLLQKISWLRQNDQKAKAMVKEANQLAQRRLMPEHIQEAARRILNEYSKAQMQQLTAQERVYLQMFRLSPSLMRQTLKVRLTLLVCCVLLVCLFVFFKTQFLGSKENGNLKQQRRWSQTQTI